MLYSRGRQSLFADRYLQAKETQMKKITGILIIGLSLFGCKEKTSDKKKIEQKAEFNQNLADMITVRAKIDQTVARGNPPEKYKIIGLEKWRDYKDSVFRDNKKILEKVLNEYGFPGIDLVGKQGSFNFWLMVQHCDFDPDFQKEVLQQMKIEVDKGNAIPRNYGLLVDRVNLNTGEKQIYGTQVAYNRKTGQAYPRDLEDSLNVNKRRESVGLEPIKKYLNHMTNNHFQMNKENMIKRGITEPKLYELKK
ncbi:Probable lipoprotein precursor [Tenacibaculum maritimum]|nr:Probable lipoprotein precursor [Tenacibaculum maritimum]